MNQPGLKNQPEADKAKDAFLETFKEIQIMAQMGDGDGCVIRLHEVIDCDDKLILVLDFAQFGEIMSWNEDNCTFETCLENKKFFKEEDIQRIMRDCLIGLYYLHTNNMVHRDIKPQNIMLDEIGKSKYGDFGTSIVLPDGIDEFSDFVGTQAFLSPECFS